MFERQQQELTYVNIGSLHILVLKALAYGRVSSRRRWKSGTSLRSKCHARNSTTEGLFYYSSVNIANFLLLYGHVFFSYPNIYFPVCGSVCVHSFLLSLLLNFIPSFLSSVIVSLFSSFLSPLWIFIMLLFCPVFTSFFN